MLLRMRFLPALFLATSSLAYAQTSSPWQLEPSETTADLRGVHAVGGGVVWASGTGGTVLRSQDSGFEWQGCATPPGAEKLDFRAIWAWDDETALVMSSGPGDQSRLYKTVDGCAHWTLLYTNPDKDGFWDGLVFRTKEEGFLLGDPVGGLFTLLHTLDGGKSWSASGGDGLEVTSQSKGAFAASNSSLLAGLREPLIFGTGGGLVYAESKVGSFSTEAHPGTPTRLIEHWDRVPALEGGSGDAAGIFSLAYHGSGTGYGLTLIAVGSDYSKPDERTGTASRSEDARHWTASSIPPGGYRSAVAWDAEHKLWIAVGPNGSDVSRDDGRTWQPMEHAPAGTPRGGEWNALSLPWVVGPHGRIAKLNGSSLPVPDSAPR